MPSQASPPRLIATIGLHASASTWVFNVVRELLVATVGATHVQTLYADTLAQLPDAASRAGKHLVIKSHPGSVELDAWLAAREARLFVSIRDPRDAALSMSQRFKVPLAHTVRWLADDCNRLLRMAPHDHPMLRYEDHFFDDPATAEHLARALGLHPTPALIAPIFARYRTDAVRAFAKTLADLPPERLTMVSSFPMDQVTQILGPHIGDTSSGKFRDLPGPEQTELTSVFRPFLDRFGYRP